MKSFQNFVLCTISFIHPFFQNNAAVDSFLIFVQIFPLITEIRLDEQVKFQIQGIEPTTASLKWQFKIDVKASKPVAAVLPEMDDRIISLRFKQNKETIGVPYETLQFPFRIFAVPHSPISTFAAGVSPWHLALRAGKNSKSHFVPGVFYNDGWLNIPNAPAVDVTSCDPITRFPHVSFRTFYVRHKIALGRLETHRDTIRCRDISSGRDIRCAENTADRCCERFVRRASQSAASESRPVLAYPCVDCTSVFYIN